jgi:hypothetical protein|tara:strand:- start:223 stop:384 length:162 start_codon:yes stop_codon:yes gene_type:complete
MDTTKWKSILVPVKTYEQIKRDAKREGRTISGQLRKVQELYTATRKEKEKVAS